VTYDLLIRHANLLNLHGAEGAGAEVEEDVCIAITGQFIARIGPASQFEQVSAQQVIEASGQLALPGFVNAHAHTPMVLFRGLAEDLPIERWFNDVVWPLEGRLTPEDAYWGALLALVEMIESGVTTVADHYLFMDEVARAVQEAGIRAELGWTYFSSQGSQGLEQGAAFAQAWQGKAEGRIRTWMAPHAPYTCTDDTLRQTAALARSLGVGIHIHAAEDRQQTLASLEGRGITPIAVLERCGILEERTLIAHGCGLLAEDIALLTPYRDHLGIAHAPAYLRLAMGLTPLRALKAAGIPVGLASDGVPSNGNFDPFEAMRLTTMLQKHERRDATAMPVLEVLKMASAGGAAALGRTHDLGTLSVGQLADLILLDLSGSQHQPLHNAPASVVYNARPSDVRTVVVDGRVLMLERKLLTLDKARIIQEANRAAKLLLRSAAPAVQYYAP